MFYTKMQLHIIILFDNHLLSLKVEFTMMSIHSLQIILVELYNDNEPSFSVSSSAFPDVLLLIPSMYMYMHSQVYLQMFLNVSHECTYRDIQTN